MACGDELGMSVAGFQSCQGALPKRTRVIFLTRKAGAYGFGPLGDACCRELIGAEGEHSPPLVPA
ncbi:MAG: hypothetical protein CVU69_06830 [Deltaproteobacteria bacterium HGW-Deltaproteobacteria-4]|nr:MAG: hypothetical protein CVU69_06830 [Deltaproteobacteria bacterium HGW-Deltaproteobacteria-4]